MCEACPQAFARLCNSDTVSVYPCGHVFRLCCIHRVISWDASARPHKCPACADADSVLGAEWAQPLARIGPDAEHES